MRTESFSNDEADPVTIRNSQNFKNWLRNGNLSCRHNDFIEHNNHLSFR